MTTQTQHDTGNVIAFTPRRDTRTTLMRGGSVVLPFDARRAAPGVEMVVDIDAWYHQAEIEDMSGPLAH